MNQQELTRHIEKDFGDLPYIVIEKNGGIIEIQRIDRTGWILEENGGRSRPVEKSWQIKDFAEWEVLREEIHPTVDVVGAYKIYRDEFASDPSDTYNQQWMNNMLDILKGRGISQAQADEMILNGQYDA